MLNSVKKFLSPPDFPDDEEKTRLTVILYTMIFSFMILLTFIVVGIIFLFSEKLLNSIFVIILFFILFVIFLLSKHGYLRIASVVYIYVFWSISTFLLYLGGGTSSPQLSFYIALSVTAGILLGIRWAVAVAFQCILIVFIVALLEIKNYPFPESFPLPPISRWFDFTLFLLFTIIPVHMTLKRLSTSLKCEREENEQRKITEELLKESERKFREIVNNIPGIVFQFCTDQHYSGIFTYLSPSCSDILDSDICTGSNVFELGNHIYHEDINDFYISINNAVEHSSKWQFEGRIFDRNGDIIWIHALASPTVTPQGTIFDCVIFDITERKHLEEQYRQVQKMEAIGLLAGGIAHDFNNILTPIMGYLDLALMNLNVDDETYSQIQTVRDEAKMAADLTKQILAFSRKQVLETQICNLNQIISSFQKMVHRIIGEDIELMIISHDEPCLIKADVGQIEQVLMNLTINARDAMPSGGKLIVETSNEYLDDMFVKKYAHALLPGYYVKLTFSDTGHGMDAETCQHIFEPFFTTKNEGQGTGLGLSTVFGIIKQHSGNISVYSEPGKGSTFKIYLPAVELSEQENAVAEGGKDVSLTGAETVLVVEDKDSLCNMIYHTLSAFGYKVIKFNKGEEAVDFIQNYKAEIHLVITDVIMPGINGKELYDKIFKIYPGIKVLYISGYTNNVIAHHGILEEGINFLQKPFSIQTLLKKVRAVLDQNTN